MLILNHRNIWYTGFDYKNMIDNNVAQFAQSSKKIFFITFSEKLYLIFNVKGGYYFLLCYTKLLEISPVDFSTTCIHTFLLCVAYIFSLHIRNEKNFFYYCITKI